MENNKKDFNTQINDLLLTALGYVLYKFFGNKVNHIILEGHGREEIDNSIDIGRTLGWFTTVYPVRLEIKDDIGESIKYIKEYLRAIPNNGIGYGVLSNDQDNVCPKISFNYLGQFDSQQSLGTVNEFWNVVYEGSGESVDKRNRDPNIININGLVINGVLQFSIVSKFSEADTNKLALLFRSCLEDIIYHTVNCTRSYMTISDIGSIIIQDYLNKVQGSKELGSVYLANSLQQGFIYHYLTYGMVDDAYKVQLIWQYNTAIDIIKLKESWCYTQARFGTLRLRFSWEEELIQIIDKEGVLDWRYFDLTDETDFVMQKLKIKQIQQDDRSEAYNLEHGPLFRLYLIKQSKMMKQTSSVFQNILQCLLYPLELHYRLLIQYPMNFVKPIFWW